MDRIWDPLRKKEVKLTPEEQVRQWFISVLEEEMGVPQHMMMSEVAFKLGKKCFRADIIIYGKNLRPVAIVECKRPEVSLSQEVIEQVVRYNMTMGVKYIIITNGNSTFIHGPEGFTAEAPKYENMIL